MFTIFIDENNEELTSIISLLTEYGYEYDIIEVKHTRFYKNYSMFFEGTNTGFPIVYKNYDLTCEVFIGNKKDLEEYLQKNI